MKARILFALPVLVITACGAGRSGDIAPVQPLPSPTTSVQAISESNLGHLWPFQVDHGTISCRGGNQALFTAPDGNRYALNDAAEQAGFPKPGMIRATGASWSTVSLGAIRSAALALCAER